MKNCVIISFDNNYIMPLCNETIDIIIQMDGGISSDFKVGEFY